MRIPNRTLILLGAIVLVAAAAVPASGAEGTDAITGVPCAMCHDVLSQEFVNNPHASVAFQRSREAVGKTVCEVCHGNGDKHMDEGGDPSLIQVPAGEASQKLCLTCHADQLHTSMMASGVHAAAKVYCTDCHKVHQGAGVPRARLLRNGPDDLCASCHPAQAASFRKPFAHRLGAGGMDCATCHDPHSGAESGEASLRLGRTGDGPCVTCHTEKRGPFVFPHVNGVAGNCMSCHEPHGSSNPKRLIRARVAQLCLECHSDLPGTTLGSQPPSFHDLRSPRYQNCTTCHVAVHGSNSSPALLR